MFKPAFAAENNELTRQMEEMDNKGSNLSRTKALLMSQHEELKKQFDEEVKVCAVNQSNSNEANLFCSDAWVIMWHSVCRQAKALLSSSLSALRQECDTLKEQLEEEQESKQELQRLVSKLNSDVTHWRSRHEADAIQHSDELEEAKYALLNSDFLCCSCRNI